MAKDFLATLAESVLSASGAIVSSIGNAAIKTILGPAVDEAKQYAKAYLAKPESHDLERSLRFAALLACLTLVREHAKIEETEAAGQRSASPDTFCPAARKWLHGQLVTLGEVQEGAHQARVTAYQASLNTALASQPDQRDAARASEGRKTAEKEMWQELNAALSNQEFPTDFEGRFLGTTGHGWFGFFITFLREALKNQDDTRNAFFIGGLSDLRNAVTRIEEGQARLEDNQNQLLQAQAKIQAQLSEVLAATARDKGVPIAPLQAVLARLGVLNVTPDDIPARLEAAATRLLELEKTLAQPIQGDATAQAAREEARRLIDRGDFDAAAATLRQGRQEARNRRENGQRIDATMAADEANLAKLALRYREAAALFAEAGELVRFDPKASWAYRLEQANALSSQGDELGDNAALRDAITVFQDALLLTPRERARLAWATTQNYLGNALARLGDREAGTARLEEAVTAYRKALEERTRERVPLDWAMTQNNLGVALSRLGEREADTARLGEAVTAHRAALEELTRERVPLDWAMTQNNLGNALSSLGGREPGTARLKEAVNAFREALTEWRRDRVWRYWATTQNNLGNALRHLGVREGNTARLKEAVTAYRAALEERTRERVPLEWAATQNNIGVALGCLWELEDGLDWLEEAVTAYRAALEEYTRERVPLDWAMTQNNLGNALTSLGEREGSTARLQEAINAYRAALAEWTRSRVPLDWAGTQYNLANALSSLGERERGTERLEEAVTAYRAALEEWTRERVPLDWAAAQNNLGAALQNLGERDVGTSRLEEAVAAFKSALEERTRTRAPHKWANTQFNLGNCIAALAARSATSTEYFSDAITHMKNAVDGFREVGDGYWEPIAAKRLAELKAQAQ